MMSIYFRLEIKKREHSKNVLVLLNLLTFVPCTHRRQVNGHLKLLFLDFFEATIAIFYKYEMLEKMLEIKDSQHSFRCSFTTASVLAV